MAAELLARRNRLLERRPDGRDAPSPSCSSIWPGARAVSPRPTCAASGRWCGLRRASSSATGLSPARTDGRRMAAIRPSRSPWRSPRSSPPPISPTSLPRPSRRNISARPPISGTADRALDLCHRHAACRKIRRRRLLCPHRPAGNCRRRLAARRLRADQEPAAADSSLPAAQMVSPDALALVRFGLRAADDPRIVNTVRVIDALLKVDLPARARAGTATTATATASMRTAAPSTAPASAGHGLCSPASARITSWPPADRAEAETAARRARGVRQRRAACCRSRSGTRPTFPSANCSAAGPSGSAMPLVWAHAEHIKLLRSLADGRVFDMPPQTYRALRGTKASARAPPLASQSSHQPDPVRRHATDRGKPGGAHPLVERRLDDEPRCRHECKRDRDLFRRPADSGRAAEKHHSLHVLLARSAALGRQGFCRRCRGVARLSEFFEGDTLSATVYLRTL